MKVLYVGNISAYGATNTSLHRLSSLQRIVGEICAVDSTPSIFGRYFYSFNNLLFQKGLHVPLPDVEGLNRRIVKMILEKYYDVIWIDKGLRINRETFRIIKRNNPQTKIVGYSPDDMKQRHSQSLQFLQSLPYYDVFFTTKSYNVKELEDLGCKRVEFVNNAYDDKFHYPREVTKSDVEALGGDVGFIGSYELERSNSIKYLAEHGIKVRIWGDGWEKSDLCHVNIKIENRGVFTEDFPKAISAFKINLGFLRKINRDLQTTRTMEIPACGGFMLMERTDEQLSLFEEGVQAEFWSTNEELLEKCEYYLKNESTRVEIAKRGRLRCVNSGYSNIGTIQRALNIINEL